VEIFGGKTAGLEGEGLEFGARRFLLGREKGILDPMRQYDELFTLGGFC
jgi:hypothetical protein